MKIGIVEVGVSATLLCAAIFAMKGELTVKKPIDELRVKIGANKSVPDPAKIQFTGDWYFLDHVSSGLVGYSNEERKFVPRLAEKWSVGPDGVYRFTLRKDARFSDGSPLTAKDVEASIKRLIAKRTSTHFPLWDYIEGTDQVVNLTSSCSAIRVLSEHEIEIDLKSKSESFFLQLASPETGIWSTNDIDPVSLELKPTRFSGPYFFAGLEGDDAILKRNDNSPISKEFPNSPRRLRLSTAPLPEAEQKLSEGQLDFLIRPYRPYGEPNWKEYKVAVSKSTPSTIIYLHGTGKIARTKVGQDFLEAVWQLNSDHEVLAADTFLPFSDKYNLSRNEVLSSLPEHTTGPIRIAIPWTYFAREFTDLLVKAGEKVGSKIELVALEKEPWGALFDDPNGDRSADFILHPYVASERYPAVQLRYITGALRSPPIDLKPADTPDLTPEKIQTLKDYQKWLVKDQMAVPLFFIATQSLYAGHLDLGEQSTTDAEIELWRVVRK